MHYGGDGGHAVVSWDDLFGIGGLEMGVADGFTVPVDSGILNAESVIFNLGLLLRQLKAPMQGSPVCGLGVRCKKMHAASMIFMLPER
jgi:hypothetical protein